MVPRKGWAFLHQSTIRKIPHRHAYPQAILMEAVHLRFPLLSVSSWQKVTISYFMAKHLRSFLLYFWDVQKLFPAYSHPTRSSSPGLAVAWYPLVSLSSWFLLYCPYLPSFCSQLFSPVLGIEFGPHQHLSRQVFYHWAIFPAISNVCEVNIFRFCM